MSKLRFLSAGESHGEKLSVILEGVPAGFSIDTERINQDLSRRQQGYGRSARMKIEKDVVHISSGLMHGRTMGNPVSMELINRDHAQWQDRQIPPMTIPRPGHADFTAALKYGHRDFRFSLERASARETATRVCVGAFCKELLAPFGIRVNACVQAVGSVSASLDKSCSLDALQKALDNAANNPFAFADTALVGEVETQIYETMKAKDSLGGILLIVAQGLPVGLGSFSQWDTRLEAKIAQALLSIPAMKGIEFGYAFDNATQRGTAVHDAFRIDDEGKIKRPTNRAGGFEGGITNGEAIVVRLAMKPLSTTLKPQYSFDAATGTAAQTQYERSDYCALTRALPIAEGMLAFVIARALFEKIGGDSLGEMLPRFESLKQAKLSDFAIHNEPWQWDMASCT